MSLDGIVVEGEEVDRVLGCIVVGGLVGDLVDDGTVEGRVLGISDVGKLEGVLCDGVNDGFKEG